MFENLREGHMTKIETRDDGPSRTGLVLHAAGFYDLFVWVVTLGRERAFREEMLRLAHLEPGESVLDVGCGTGTLAIAAKLQVGTTGTVYAVDASREMIDQGREESESRRRRSRF
jgi:ubiquinone/menaquinone biosynthesis C-methylase UbiE